MLEGVSPAEEEQAANVGASPALGGRSGLTDLMEAIEDIDGPAEPSDDEDETAPAADAGDEITDDFLNPTSAWICRHASVPSPDGASRPAYLPVATDCFICTEPIQFHALGSCNHRVCHVCSLRLRALYKVKSCAYCKRDLDRVVFTRSSDRPYKSFSKRDLPFEDRKLAIRFEDREMFEDTMVLLRFNCPEPTCDVACPGGWKELKRHVKEGHNLLLW